jgi:hypothetical protein
MSLKVIGAGLPRTGTTSLKVALEILLGGYCYHMSEVFKNPDHAALWRAAARGETINWDELFSGCTAAVDTPTCLFWPELMEVYPQALVLLSVRDAQGWFESCSQTIFHAREVRARARARAAARHQTGAPPPDPAREPRPMMEEVFRRMPFLPNAGPEATIEGYERHNSAVRAAVPAHRLLVWEPGDGWDPLCAALKVPVPKMPFPRLNSRRSWRYRTILQSFVGKRLAEKAIEFTTPRSLRPR